MLVNSPRKDREHIPEMLSDIESLLGWKALQRLLYGGKKRERGTLLPGITLSEILQLYPTTMIMSQRKRKRKKTWTRVMMCCVKKMIATDAKLVARAVSMLVIGRTT